jgi:hypothetical protein
MDDIERALYSKYMAASAHFEDVCQNEDHILASFGVTHPHYIEAEGNRRQAYVELLAAWQAYQNYVRKPVRA